MPDFFEQLRNIQGNIALGMMIAGERPISNVFGGKIAFVYFGNDASKSVYVSLGEQGKMIADLSRSFLSDNSMYTLNVHDKFLAGTSIGHVNNHLKLEIPTFATDFGENGIDGFVNMKELTTHEPDLLAEYPFLQSISWVKLSANIDGSTIRIQGKNKRYGILKQVADVYLELIKKQLKMFS